MRNLCRASHIIVTKCQGPTDEALLAKMRKYNPTAEVIETTHGPIAERPVQNKPPFPINFEGFDREH